MTARLRLAARTVVRVLALAAVLWLIAEVLGAIDPRVPALAVLAGLGWLCWLKGKADGYREASKRRFGSETAWDDYSEATS